MNAKGSLINSPVRLFIWVLRVVGQPILSDALLGKANRFSSMCLHGTCTDEARMTK